MESEGELVARLIAEEFGPKLQEDLMRMLGGAYREADRGAKEYDRAQFKKVYGHLRIAAIEQGMKLLCQKHPGIEALDTRIESGSYEYTAVRTHSLVITASHVRDRDRVPRKAVYRETLAKGINYFLFPDMEETEEPERRFYHVILLHSFERIARIDEARRKVINLRRTDRPGFADLVVPTAEGLLVYRLSLFDKYPAVVDEIRGIVRPDVATERRPKPRRPRIDDTGTDKEQT
jgi:hypothetical protein